MKYYSTLSYLQFPWDQVAQCYWRKYPNPHSKHVLTEDTINRWFSSDSHFHTIRLLTKTNALPRWGEVIVRGPRHVCIVEEAEVDLHTRTLTTYTRNIGYTRLLNLHEKCIYRPAAGNEQLTECERHAWISSSVFGLSFAIQAFAVERFKKNAVRALQGFEHVLTQAFPIETPQTEGATHSDKGQQEGSPGSRIQFKGKKPGEVLSGQVRIQVVPPYTSAGRGDAGR